MTSRLTTLRRAARAQAGFTLIELMIASSLSIVLLLATLAMFDVFSSNTVANSHLTQAQDDARSRVQVIVNALRNASGPSGSNAVVGTPGAYDVSINTDRPGFGIASGTPGTARYCLDSSANGRLWLNWTTTSNASAGATCPAAGWTQRVLLSSTRNQALGKALFSYDTTTVSSLRSIRVDLHTQLGSSTTKTTHLQSAAALRSLPDTSPGLPNTTVSDGSCDANDLLSLDIAAVTDANGLPVDIALYQKTNAADPESNWLQIGSGPGMKVLKRAPGVNRLVVKITNALGRTEIINRNVSCP